MEARHPAASGQQEEEGGPGRPPPAGPEAPRPGPSSAGGPGPPLAGAGAAPRGAAAASGPEARGSSSAPPPKAEDVARARASSLSRELGELGAQRIVSSPGGAGRPAGRGPLLAHLFAHQLRLAQLEHALDAAAPRGPESALPEDLPEAALQGVEEGFRLLLDGPEPDAASGAATPDAVAARRHHRELVQLRRELRPVQSLLRRDGGGFRARLDALLLEALEAPDDAAADADAEAGGEAEAAASTALALVPAAPAAADVGTQTGASTALELRRPGADRVLLRDLERAQHLSGVGERWGRLAHSLSGRPVAPRALPPPEARRNEPFSGPGGVGVDLAGEVRELQTTLRGLLEAQLELQRVVHLELAAAVRPGGAPTARLSPGRCIICCEDGAPADTAFYRCGHTVSCAECALTLMQKRAPCPICRAEIRDVLRVYVGVEPPPAEG